MSGPGRSRGGVLPILDLGLHNGDRSVRKLLGRLGRVVFLSGSNSVSDVENIANIRMVMSANTPKTVINATPFRRCFRAANSPIFINPSV